MVQTQNTTTTNKGNQPENNFQEIDFSLVKQNFSLTRFCRDEGIQIRRGGNGGYVICCPFHIEDTPSCHIFDDRRFTCFGCGAKGTIIDFAQKLKPSLSGSQWATAMYLIDTQGSGRKEDYFKSDRQQCNRSTSLQPSRPVVSIATPPAVHTLKIDRDKVLAITPDTVIAVGDQLFNPRHIKAREYAEERGWLKTPPHVSSYQLGAMAAGEKNSFLSKESSIAFPKLIQTRRTAEVFGLEQEFEENGRLLCAGIKKRLLPDTISKWESLMQKKTTADLKSSAPRWICKAGFVTEIPWEFDCNEDADVLIIAEGPGDGLRLFNEANADEKIRSRFGSRWHVTAVDSCHIWTLNSIPRRPVSWGKQNFSVSFFDGFSHVIILLDGDEPGRKGAANIVELARRQNPQAIVRNVVLPDNQDVCDFFDAGNTMSDLSELLRATQPVV